MSRVRQAAEAPRLPWFGVAGAALLTVAGGVAFYAASRNAGTNAAGGAGSITIAIRAGRCEPNALTVPEGRSTFRIVNETDRIVEWEILDGVMVMAERENIAPGIARTVGARLHPGDYTITCGLLSNPRGTLTVAPAAGSRDDQAPLVVYIGPLAEYQVYLGAQARMLVEATEALDAAIRVGDVERAKASYSEARLPWSRLEPVAGRFADLKDAIDPVATYLGGREDYPAFVGFHRIERALSGGNTTDVAAVSGKLASDAKLLKERLKTARLTPQDMSDGASRLLERIAEMRVPNGENLYDKSDLVDLAAETEGVRRIVGLLKPVVVQRAPNVVAEIDRRLALLESCLFALRGPDGYPAYDTVDAHARQELAEDLRALAAAVDRMGASVGSGNGEESNVDVPSRSGASELPT